MSEDSGQLCWQQRWYQGRGTKRTIFPLVERGGPIGKVLVHRWWPECYRQFQQGLTNTVVHQGVYISRRILLLRSYGSQGRLNKSMERKMWSSDQTEQWKGKCVWHIYQGYTLPKDKQSMIPMAGYKVENPLDKRREISWHYPYNGTIWVISTRNI